MADRPRRGARINVFVALIFYWTYIPTCNAVKKDPRNQFYTHAVIQPTIYTETREKRSATSSIKTKVVNEDKLTVGFVAFGKNFVLDLHMNKDLLPEDYFEKHQQSGKYVINLPMKTEQKHCHYQGHIQGIEHSWAAISICNGISGVIYDGSDLHYIEPDHISSNSSHFLFKASDVKPQNLSCGVSNTESFPLKTKEFDIIRRRRSTMLKGPFKSNAKSRYVELIIVNDNREFKEFNQDQKKVFERSKQIANIVNGLYTPLNIYVALVGVIVWSESNEIKMSPDADETLTSFLNYRKERLAQEHPNDNAQLITAMTFDGGVVGKALRGTICTYEYSGGVNMDHSHVLGLVATTVAHELGHNFGFEHDTDECQCPEDKCIMSPSSSSSTSPRHWSSCSLQYLDLAFSKGMDYCLKNRPSKIVGSVCGNGFLEDGEECDCGLKEYCDNHCCNASSCQLFDNATCAMGECCDMETCQVKKTATLCRSAVSVCDLPEYCDGNSEFCPDDTFHRNGDECGKGKAYCFDGKCQSHEDQCKLLWGQTGKMSDARCYEQNYKAGNANGNCGYNMINQTYKACKKDDMLCGMLHCTHLNERLEFGMESAAILARSFINVRGKVFTCRSAIVDLGLFNVDPGMAPNGAKCGDEKACVNQKCTPVSTLKKVECPHQCSLNGICNNRGNCHCKRGYAPPFCDSTGPGGSIDSGPASDPSSYREEVAMYFIFLGLLPLIVITFAVIYYYRSHLRNWRSRKAHKASIKSRTQTTTQKRVLPPSKFNFDRNSLRTLEISAPIPAPSAPALDKYDSAPPHSPVKNNSTRPNFQQTSQSIPPSDTTRLIPVRPAPPKPDKPSSWSSATAGASLLRSSSLRSPEDSVHPITTRPGDPPPQPPLNDGHSSAGCQQNVYDDVASCENSAYYDDCQALDFSDTALAFVHSSKLSNPASQQNKICDKAGNEESLVRNFKKNLDKSNQVNSMCNREKAMSKTLFPQQASLVASLAQKFEVQNNEDNLNGSSKKPPLKSRPWPPRPGNPQV